MLVASIDQEDRMAEARKPTKKVVRVESTPEAKKEGASSWKPTAESKGKATTRRVIAVLLWLLAIGGEAFAIFWVLKRPKENGEFPTWAWILLLGILVAVALLAFGGSQLWKQANRLDPASTSNPVRFFVQNQLGAIITLIAFVPLIVLIFLNKDMSGKQKGIAGSVGIVLLLVAGFFGTELNSASVEQYSAEAATVHELTGGDEVFWVQNSDVYHLCGGASDLQHESQDDTIYSGTVADAHAAGLERLTLKVDEEVGQCGFDVAA
jgi:hypothetical protein